MRFISLLFFNPDDREEGAKSPQVGCSPKASEWPEDAEGHRILVHLTDDGTRTHVASPCFLMNEKSPCIPESQVLRDHPADGTWNLREIQNKCLKRLVVSRDKCICKCRKGSWSVAISVSASAARARGLDYHPRYRHMDGCMTTMWKRS